MATCVFPSIFRSCGVFRRQLSGKLNPSASPLEIMGKIPSKKTTNFDLEALGKINPVVKNAIELANVNLPENAEILKRVNKENERLQLYLEDAFADGEAHGKLEVLRSLKKISKMSEKDLRELCKAEGIPFEDLEVL